MEKGENAVDIGSIGSRLSVTQEQVANHQFGGFTKDGKKIVREISQDGVVSVKIDPDGEKADAERTKKLREIMQKVYAGTKLKKSPLAQCCLIIPVFMLFVECQ